MCAVVRCLAAFALLLNSQPGLGNVPQSGNNERFREAAGQQIVPLYSSGSRALTMITIGEGPPAPVVFDTGEDKAFLVPDYAKRLNLSVVGSSSFVDEATGARSTVPLVRLVSPKLSGVAFELTEARVVDYAEPDMVGVVGPGVFSNRLVTLELSHNRVRVAPRTGDYIPRQPATPYFDHLPALKIDVGGIAVVAHLDSGADTGLSFSRTLMTKLRLKNPPVVSGKAQSASGTQDVYRGQIDGDVKIGPLVLHDPEVNFIGEGAGGNVGYDILRKLTIVMDPAGQRSWVLDPAQDSSSLAEYVGRFGPRSIRIEGQKLVHQRDGRPAFELEYLGGDLFEMTATGDRLQFYRRDGRVLRLDFITASGQVASEDRRSKPSSQGLPGSPK
jgi:hypothetical protein